MMSRDLLVVPAPAAVDEVHFLSQWIQGMFIADRVHNGIPDDATLAPVIDWQIGTVRSWIGEHLMLFIE